MGNQCYIYERTKGNIIEGFKTHSEPPIWWANTDVYRQSVGCKEVNRWGGKKTHSSTEKEFGSLKFSFICSAN